MLYIIGDESSKYVHACVEIFIHGRREGEVVGAGENGDEVAGNS